LSTPLHVTADWLPTHWAAYTESRLASGFSTILGKSAVEDAGKTHEQLLSM